jgi:hypothetical protein
MTMRITALLPIAAILLMGARCDGTKADRCPSPPQPEVCDRMSAQRFAIADTLSTWPAQAAAKPVVLYVDLSQSMRGFLDPDYPTREPTDYRRVISVIDAELSPRPINGFGNSVRVVGETALGTLGKQSIYSDGNTQMEDVFPRVLADTPLSSTHIIIGDGRRGRPDDANDQYERMRNTAAEWIRRGGTFVVAASSAPFKPVIADPSGCRTAGGEKARDDEDERSEHAEDAGGRCPLYAFAFIAPGEQTRIVAALSGVFEHLYVIPMPAVSERLVQLQPDGRSSKITLQPTWVDAGRASVARARGSAQTNDPLPASITLTDTTSPVGRASLAALRGRSLRTQLFVRPDTIPTREWQAAPVGQGLILGGDDPYHPRFISRGPGVPRYLYRIELVSDGSPSWLDEFDAENARDARRTYGLGRLFDAFQKQGAAAGPVLRAYVVVN